MKAVEDIDDLIRLKPERACELGIERTAALLAAGKVAEAQRAALRPDSRPDADLTRYLAAQARSRDRGGRSGRLAKQPSASASSRHPATRGPGSPRRARSPWLASLDAAAQIIRLAPLRAPDEAGAVLAAAILVAGGDPTLAAAVLDANRDRGPRVAAARGLVAVILEKDPAADAPFADLPRPHRPARRGGRGRGGVAARGPRVDPRGVARDREGRGLEDRSCGLDCPGPGARPPVPRVARAGRPRLLPPVGAARASRLPRSFDRSPPRVVEARAR